MKITFMGEEIIMDDTMDPGQDKPTERIEELYQALEALYDAQSGPPVGVMSSKWAMAMNQAAQALGKTERQF